MKNQPKGEKMIATPPKESRKKEMYAYYRELLQNIEFINILKKIASDYSAKSRDGKRLPSTKQELSTYILIKILDEYKLELYPPRLFLIALVDKFKELLNENTKERNTRIKCNKPYRYNNNKDRYCPVFKGSLQSRLINRIKKYHTISLTMVGIDNTISGTSYEHVILSNDKSKIKAECKTETDYTKRYKGSYKKYSKMNLYYGAVLSDTWLTSVYKKGLDYVGNYAILSADLIGRIDCGEIYECIGIRKSIGKSVKNEKIYVCVRIGKEPLVAKHIKQLIRKGEVIE